MSLALAILIVWPFCSCAHAMGDAPLNEAHSCCSSSGLNSPDQDEPRPNCAHCDAEPADVPSQMMLAPPVEFGDALAILARSEVGPDKLAFGFAAGFQPTDPPPNRQLQANWLCVFRL